MIFSIHIIIIIRPIAKKIGGLGIWEDILQIMSVIGKIFYYLIFLIFLNIFTLKVY